MELVLLLTIQAAADIQSRILLLLILVSLLPVTCIFLEESSGMSAAFICVTFLIAVVCSCFYTARRLDGMQQRIFKMALATEAQYYQVLQPEAETNQHLVRVSTILSTCSDGSFQEVLQTEQDLRRNYELAKSHMSIFQTAVCEPLVSTGLEVVAKIKSLTELDEREGAVDILYCEVWCDSLQQVQHAWDMLKDLDGVEIVSARDFFAVASSKKCCQIVMSLQGYLATVFLLEKSLSTLEAHQGICDAANSLGLLDKTSAAGWELSQRQVGSEVPGCIFVATGLLRVATCSSCVIIATGIHGLNDPYFSAWNLAMALPVWACFAILLWEMLRIAFADESVGGAATIRLRPRPTQVWYRNYLGVQGRHYAFKVAALQLITVLIQGLAKASLFRTIQNTRGSAALKSSTAVPF